jgi:hypothetical protein
MIEHKDWEIQALALDATSTMSRRSIAETLGVKRSTCLDFLRKYSSFVGEKEMPIETPEHDNSRILIISDLHAPYNHKNAVQFLSDLNDKYKFTRVISVGDECDKMALSYHESNPDLPSAGDELKAAKKVIAELHELFPKMDILESNHGSLHLRKSMTAGIPRAYIKEYNEILEVGAGWKWHDDMTITLPNGQQCYLTHGKSANGMKLSQNYAMNCIQGHHHTEFTIGYWSNPNDLFWSMQVGCLVDSKSLAMAYNKLQLRRPIIGCGVVIDSKPMLETMPL